MRRLSSFTPHLRGLSRCATRKKQPRQCSLHCAGWNLAPYMLRACCPGHRSGNQAAGRCEAEHPSTGDVAFSQQNTC